MRYEMFTCSRCGAEKAAVHFHPSVRGTIVFRSNTCGDCCRALHELRRRLRAARPARRPRRSSPYRAAPSAGRR
jgi:hypothetical protein